MMVLEEVLEKHGYIPLWHEKPFRKMNGSGKHVNWSLNYFDQSGSIHNLFNQSGLNIELFVLFILIKMKAVLSNQ
jgi:glutamine synthetase